MKAAKGSDERVILLQIKLMLAKVFPVKLYFKNTPSLICFLGALHRQCIISLHWLRLIISLSQVAISVLVTSTHSGAWLFNSFLLTTTWMWTKTNSWSCTVWPNNCSWLPECEASIWAILSSRRSTLSIHILFVCTETFVCLIKTLQLSFYF